MTLFETAGKIMSLGSKYKGVKNEVKAKARQEAADILNEYVKQEFNIIPSGKDWDKFIISPSILDTKIGRYSYEAGFKDCLIEIKKRLHNI